MVSQMGKFKKIKGIIKVIFGEEPFKFFVRRSEVISPEFVNVGNSREEAIEEFKKLHEKYGIYYKNVEKFPTSYGKLTVDKFIKFLKEYDKKFNLKYAVIDLVGVTINPSLLE